VKNTSDVRYFGTVDYGNLDKPDRGVNDGQALPAFNAANCSGVTLMIFGAFVAADDPDVAAEPAGASLSVWVFKPEVFNRTIRVIVGFRFNVVVVADASDDFVTLLARPSANFPASVSAKVREGSDTSPVASRFPESSGNKVIPCAANNLTASSEKKKDWIVDKV